MDTAPENQWIATTFNPVIEAQSRQYIQQRYGIAEPTIDQIALGRRAMLSNWLLHAAPAGLA